MSHESRTRLLTAVILVAVFGSGALLGAALDNRLGAEEPADPVVVTETEAEGAEEEAAPERGPTYMEVEPNEEQLALIQEIVAEYRTRVNELDEEARSQYRADFRVIRDAAREAIKGVLTPEQAALYQELLDERYPPADGSDEEDDQR